MWPIVLSNGQYTRAFFCYIVLCNNIARLLPVCALYLTLIPSCDNFAEMFCHNDRLNKNTQEKHIIWFVSLFRII